ncbi:hypothetical protein BDZ94DRAFT_1265689 [Collybia nuda]|uniref:F-box domain-containing protein n=1 Tax=Collybia nuda TaxID=64659 RepID=A0A9P6CH56_9AGAR|nr:hypothetical protein BDZ94DRAFT_1265689 [Collybia nuda]
MNVPEWLRTMRLEARAYSNDPLSYEDQTALRTILKNVEDDVKSLESDISRLVKVVSHLEKRHAEGLIRIDRLRVGLAPHKRLPPEILSKIFVHCDGYPLKLPPRYYRPIWSVTQVCSRWRSVALAEPLLWNQIKVRGSDRTDALNAFINEIFSNRGGQGAISYDAPWITGPEEWEDVVTLLSTYPSRLVNLRIPFVGFIPPSFETSLSLFDSLESISISFRHLARHDVEKNRFMAFSTAQNLRRALIHTPQRDNKLLSTWPTRISLPWRQLTHLNVDVVPISIFLTILHHCDSLVNCEVRLCDDPHSLEVVKIPVELNFLHSLVISDNTSYTAAEKLLDGIVTPALKILKFGEEDWDEWPQEFVLKLITQSNCSIESFETPARALAEDEILPLMRAMPQLKEFNAYTRQTISQSTLEKIKSENLAPELGKLDGWRLASIRSFIELLRSRYTTRGGGLKMVRVWVPEDIFAPEKEYFKSMLPGLTKGDRKIRVLPYSRSWENPTSESD